MVSDITTVGRRSVTANSVHRETLSPSTSVAAVTVALLGAGSRITAAASKTYRHDRAPMSYLVWKMGCKIILS